MKRVAVPIVSFAVFVSSSALAQQWSASAGTDGYSYSGPSRSKVENIGNARSWVFGVERVTGVAFESQSLEYDDPDGDPIVVTSKSTTINVFGAGAETTSTLPRLALDYFVIDGLSVGLSAVLLSRSRSFETEGTPSATAPVIATGSGADTLSFLGNLRAGYAFAFDDTFAVWGRGGIAYGYDTSDVTLSTTGMTPETGSVTGTTIDVTLDVMAVISPFKHFVMMGGPFLDLGVGGDYTVENAAGTSVDERNAKLTAFGVTFAIGGYY